MSKQIYDAPVSESDKLILELMQGDELHKRAASALNKSLGHLKDYVRRDMERASVGVTDY
jgi:hypothetical protein